MLENIDLEIPIPKEFMAEAIEIFYLAFGQKFLPLLKNEKNIKSFLRLSLRPEYLFAATSNGNIVGIAGIQIGKSKLVKTSYKNLRTEFSIFRTLMILFILKVFFNQVAKKGSLRIEAIAVHPGYRGSGIGTKLLERIEDFAIEKGLGSIILEVVDTNPRAKRLYEKLGYRKTRTVNYGFLARRAGFSSEDIMEKTLKL